MAHVRTEFEQNKDDDLWDFWLYVDDILVDQGEAYTTERSADRGAIEALHYYRTGECL